MYRPNWDPFFTAVAAGDCIAEACRLARVTPTAAFARIRRAKGASPRPGEAAWFARFVAAKETAAGRRREALRRLDGPFARMAALALEGKSQQEIARELGCWPGTVSHRLARFGLAKHQRKSLPLQPPHKPRMISPDQWDRFFTALAERGNVSEACRASGVAATTAYNHIAAGKTASPKSKAGKWQKRFAEAKETAFDRLDAAAFIRAHDGVEEPRIGRVEKDKDGPVAHVRRYSDRLLEFLLKAHRPHIYHRERVAAEPSGPRGRSIQITGRGFELPPIDESHPE